jgi:CHAT domain-containing protein
MRMLVTYVRVGRNSLPGFFLRSPLAVLWLGAAITLLGTEVNSSPQVFAATLQSSHLGKTFRATDNEPFKLRPAEIIRRQIAHGERHTYQLVVQAGQRLRAAFEGHDAEIMITLFDPNHRQVLERVSRLERASRLSWVTQFAGTYTLEVQLADAETAAGHYLLKAEPPLPTTARERMVLAAEMAVAEAEGLRQRWNAPLLRRAIRAYAEAAQLWHTLNERQPEAWALKDIGDVYLILSLNHQALIYYHRALTLSRIAGCRELEIEVINDISAIEIDLGERQKIINACNESLKLSQQLGDRHGEARSLNNLGLAFYYLRAMEKTLDMFNRALVLCKASGDYRGQAESLTNLGYTYGDLGDIHQAMNCFTEALALWHRAKDRRNQARVLMVIGLENTLKGEMQKSLNAYKEANEVFQAIADRNGQALILNGMGHVYLALGDMQKALYSYKRALRLQQLLNHRPSQAVIMRNIGIVYSALGDKRKALDYFSRKLKIVRALKDPRLTAYTFNDIGQVYDALEQRGKALDFYQQALALFETVSDPRGQAYALNSIGYIDYRSGKGQSALECFNKALSLLHAAEDRTNEVVTLHNLARVQRSLGDLDDAANHARAMIELIESMRSKVDSQQLRTSYFASVHQHYELAIDVLMAMHKRDPAQAADAAAFAMSERARARGLLEMLNESRIDIHEGADPALLRRERELELLLNVKSERQVRILSNKHSEQEAVAIKKEIADLASEYQENKAQMRSTSPRYAALTQPQILSPAEIQQKVVDADSLLLEYSLGEERSYLWAITASSIKSYELPGSRQIEKLARRARELIAAFQRSQQAAMPTDGLLAQYEDTARQLSQILLAPVTSDLNSKRLLIVADGILQYISFPSLPSPIEPGTAVPLIVDHEVVIIPSASTLAMLRSQTGSHTPAAHDVAVFADPVFERTDPRVLSASQGASGASALSAAKPRSIRPRRLVWGFRSRSGDVSFPRLLATRREAEMILSQARPGASLLATDFQASRKMAVRPELAQYRILHLATHGLFDSEHPELSALVLSLVDEQGQPQNGFLRLHDLYNLNLPVELIVLSACDTALGKNVKGEGMLGMTRGFMYAGAARIVASLWKVDDDATAELMQSFYKKMLAEHMSPAAALRAAQVEMYHHKQWRAPFYWAAFIFQGEWE